MHTVKGRSLFINLKGGGCLRKTGAGVVLKRRVMSGVRLGLPMLIHDINNIHMKYINLIL